MARRSSLGVAWVSLVVGCSSGTTASSPDASSPPAPARTSTTRASRVLAQLAAHSPLRDRLGRGATLVETGGGLRLASDGSREPRAQMAGGGALDVTLPARADHALRVARADRPGVYLDVTTALAAVAGERVEGAVVYEGAAKDVDVVQSFDGTRAEELRLIRDAAAASRTTWTLRAGASVSSLRLRDGRVEVLEGDVVRLSSTPMFAIDAKGVVRAPTLALQREGDRWTLVATLDVAGLSAPIALDPGWTSTFNALSYNHWDNSHGVALPDGRVATFPEWGSPDPAPVDLYDPATDRWTPTTTKVPNRPGATPIYLPVQKKVLLAAGSWAAGSSWQLWDPATGAMTAAKAFGFNLDTPITLTLPNGKVFLQANGAVDAAIYDPATDTVTKTASYSASWGGSAGVVMASGKVLLTGGCCNTGAARIYDPTNDTWATAPGMWGARSGHSMNRLPSGKILVTGNDSSGTISAELYDETAATWTKLTPPRAIGGHRTLTLPSGAVLIVNNGLSTDTLIYDETSGWSDGPKMVMRRDGAGIAPLPGGRVLLLGGNSGSLGTAQSPNTAEVLTLGAKTCTGSADCGGGPCVDGYCCDRGCTETCYACNVAGREGFCSPVTGAPAGARSCAPFATCYGGACITACTTNADCVAGLACIFGSCATKLTNGTACFAPTDCASGNCVDGVCCDATCGEQCKACDVPGAVGKCTSVTGAPHGTRTSCGAYTCGGGGACKATCTGDGDCSAGNFCSGGACVTSQLDGKSCAGDKQCQSGHCVDGYCCDSVCGAPCQTCAKAGKLGVCSLVAAGDPDPRGACQGECASGCGASGCQYKPADTVCGGSCLGNQLTSGGRCTGTSEKCAGATTTPCAGGLKCLDAKSCRGSCGSATDCVTGGCDVTSGLCVTPLPDAGPEAAPDAGAETSTDATTDSAVATDTATDSAADSATAAETEADSTADAPLPPGDGDPAQGWPHGDATPIQPPGAQRCSFDAECPTGFCVDGVCCDSRCDTPCHSCALLTSPGKCTAEPYGVDLKQDCGRSLDCFATCGGNGQCVGAGPGVMCARNRCTGPSSGVGAAFCAAAQRACPADEGVPFECGAYACDPAFGACKTACTSTDDCAPGNVCELTTKTCAPTPVASSGDSGCAIDARPGGTAGGAGGSRELAAGLATLAAIGLARRRRARR